MKTGQLIKELRLKKGMTQEDLAAKTYISGRTIQRIENGDVEPRAYTLQTIASALEVDFQELINCDKADADVISSCDTYSFYSKKIPSIILGSGGFSEHHTTQDKIDLIDFEHLYKAAKLLHSFIMELGNK